MLELAVVIVVDVGVRVAEKEVVSWVFDVEVGVLN